MATIRGRAKRDIDRAANNAKRIGERLCWIMEEYSEYPDYVSVIKQVIETSFIIEQMIYDLRKLAP